MIQPWFKSKVHTSIIVGLLFSLSGCNDQSPAPDMKAISDVKTISKQQLLNLINARMQRHHIVGLSIAVLDDQQLMFSDGFGYANLESKVRASEHSIYRAGSISKLFTTAAIMQLSEASKVAIDAPLVEALPDFSIHSYEAQSAAITPRMLMTHHAGLPGDYIEGMWSEHPEHFSTVIAHLHTQYTSFAPNKIHAYSNQGFDVLGSVVERVSGQPFERYMQEHLLSPLGMQHSTFEAIAPHGPDASRAYDEKGKLTVELALRDVPAGGLNTSVVDLLQFVKMLFAQGHAENQNLLSPSSIMEMQRTQNQNSPMDVDVKVGLGWHFYSKSIASADVVLFHDGATLNHRAILMIEPKQKIAVAVLSNSADAREAINEIAEQALVLAITEKSGNIATPVNNKAQPSAYPPSAMASFAGYYSTPLGFIQITQANNTLKVNFNGTSLALKQQADGYMKLEYKLLGLIPQDIGQLGKALFTMATIAGENVLLASSGSEFLLAGQKIQPTPIPPAWQSRLGDYEYASDDAYLHDQIKGIKLFVEDNFLLAEVQGKQSVQKVALDPVLDTQAVIRGLGRGLGETVFADKTGNVDVLRYSGMTFKRKLADN